MFLNHWLSMICDFESCKKFSKKKSCDLFLRFIIYFKEDLLHTINSQSDVYIHIALTVMYKSFYALFNDRSISLSSVRNCLSVSARLVIVLHAWSTVA